MAKIKALVFDAYGTLLDVHSVVMLCDRLFLGRGTPLSQLWRAKQLEYTWLRSLMGRYADFTLVMKSKPSNPIRASINSLPTGSAFRRRTSDLCPPITGTRPARKISRFRVFWINRSGAPPDRLDAAPDSVLGKLTELASHLG